MTTAPRPVPTKDQSIQSFRAAGFTERLFVSPDGQVPPFFDTNVLISVKQERLGVLKNWAYTLGVLLKTGADHLMVMQDDVTWAAGSAEIVYAALGREAMGFVSWYVDPKVGREVEQATGRRPAPAGWYDSRLGGDSGGALCYSFDREVAQRLMDDPQFQDFLATRERNIDRLVPKCLMDLGIPMRVRMPGLVHHQLGSGNSSIKPKKPRDTFYFQTACS